MISFTVASTSFAGPAAENRPSSIALNAEICSCKTMNDEAHKQQMFPVSNPEEATDLPYIVLQEN